MSSEPWRSTTLGDYARIIMGQSPESEYYTLNEQDVPFLQGNRTFGSKYPTFDTYTSKVTKIAPKGSVIVSVRAPVGDTNIAPVELCLGRGVAAMISKDPNNEFLYYLVKSLIPLMNQNENGSTFGSINRNDLERLPITLPGSEERFMIGHILSSIDDKIELNQAINDNLLDICRLEFQKIANASTDIVMLSDLADVCYGKDHKQLKDGNYPVYGSGGIIRYCERPLYEGRESVLIPRKGTLNNVMFISEPFWSVDTMFYTRMKKDCVGKYLFFWLSGLDLASMNSGSAVPSMTTETLNGIEIRLPEREVIEMFDKSIDPLFDCIKFNNQYNTRLMALREYLLPKLMSGEIDVSTLNCQLNNHLVSD